MAEYVVTGPGALLTAKGKDLAHRLWIAITTATQTAPPNLKVWDGLTRDQRFAALQSAGLTPMQVETYANKTLSGGGWGDVGKVVGGAVKAVGKVVAPAASQVVSALTGKKPVQPEQPPSDQTVVRAGYGGIIALVMILGLAGAWFYSRRSK